MRGKEDITSVRILSQIARTACLPRLSIDAVVHGNERIQKHHGSKSHLDTRKLEIIVGRHKSRQDRKGTRSPHVYSTLCTVSQALRNR